MCGWAVAHNHTKYSHIQSMRPNHYSLSRVSFRRTETGQPRRHQIEDIRSRYHQPFLTVPQYMIPSSWHGRTPIFGKPTTQYVLVQIWAKLDHAVRPGHAREGISATGIASLNVMVSMLQPDA